MDSGVDAGIAAWAEARRVRVEPSRSAHWQTTGAMGLCLALHLAFFLWLYHDRPQVTAKVAASTPALVVRWIESRDIAAALPMPRKPRPVRSAAPDRIRTQPDVTPSMPAHETVPTPNPTPRLSDQIDDANLLSSDDGVRYRPDPMRPIAPRLPGSDRRITGNFNLRREISPKDMVAMVGRVFGAYDSCRDVPGLMQDATLLKPQRYDDAQRRDLIERERRCSRR